MSDSRYTLQTTIDLKARITGSSSQRSEDCLISPRSMSLPSRCSDPNTPLVGHSRALAAPGPDVNSPFCYSHAVLIRQNCFRFSFYAADRDAAEDSCVFHRPRWSTSRTTCAMPEGYRVAGVSRESGVHAL
ncbi:hypothetical protein OBBRIDRAFT_110929 [Obba rivulosa]|uniref:Uncharacterized protein n=1 Tax=Obba rivulosa TaxID=1052685 RepID=A0A8E2ARQ1_9APHY|nr:hypothetical protein OBBRIDRAFT_110929 [Obba rivulosa]